MEGLLLVPPDRGTIIGRALWKPRYVILGSPIRLQQNQDSLSRSSSSHRLEAARRGLISSPMPLGEEAAPRTADQTWFSVYKQKGDWEAITQHQMTTIKSCEIQSIQYKKPGPSVPTLVITLELDAASEKSRKRRSSRASGMSSMAAYPNSILFRSVPDDKYNIYDWQMAVQPLIRINSDMESPMSPKSPSSPHLTSFKNPFSSKQSSNSSRPDLPHRTSSNTYSSSATVQRRSASNQQSSVLSPSPSLRSRRSDLSSQASSLTRPQGYQNSFPIQHPLDLPSPASTANYEDQLISGWTSAQGRSSALSNHTRGSNSVSMTGTPPAPPAPTQTILDRAFQMRMIPGSERSGEDDASKLSSIARFEALMRETDDRIKAGKVLGRGSNRTTRNRGWNLDEEDEIDGLDDRPGTGQSDSLYLEESEEEDCPEPISYSVHEIPTPAQRALEYIAGRTLIPSSRPTSGRSMPVGFRSQSPSRTSSAVPPPLPRSVTTDAINFIHAAPNAEELAKPKSKSRPVSMALPSTSTANTSVDELALPSSVTNLKRRSSTSTKRLSFTEFAKRLSSGSSMLIVQSNRSNRSSVASEGRASSEASRDYAEDDHEFGMRRATNRGLSHSRLSSLNTPGLTGLRGGGGDSTKQCGWRGSGFGGEF